MRAYRRVHHFRPASAHYGVFSGNRWNSKIYPLLRDFVHVNSRGAGPDAADLKLTTKLHRA